MKTTVLCICWFVFGLYAGFAIDDFYHGQRVERLGTYHYCDSGE